MDYSANLRKLNQTEIKIISNTLSKISNRMISFLKKNEVHLYVLISNDESKIIYPKIFFVSSKLINTIESLAKKSNIVSIGVYLGFIKRGKFLLSIEGAEFLNEHGVIPEGYKWFVNNEGEKAIFYGNDIQKKMINLLSNRSKKVLKKGELTFFFNTEKELISIGLIKSTTIDYEKLDSHEIVAQNLIDKGYYLRKDQ